VSGFVHDLERVANAVLTAEQAAERLTAELASMGVKAEAHAVTHAVTPTVGIWLEPDDDGPIASLPVSEANARTISRLVRSPAPRSIISPESVARPQRLGPS
jgi:hypothetical protein